MSKTVNYDFQVMSMVSVEAPYGTNPETLHKEALSKLLERVRQNDIELDCETMYDSETGSYEEVPEDWYNGGGK